MKKNLIEAYGWYGAIAILAAYALISFSFLSTGSVWYHLLSGTGAIGIVIAAFNKKDYPSSTLNIIYALIAVISLYRILMYASQ